MIWRQKIELRRLRVKMGALGVSVALVAASACTSTPYPASEDAPKPSARSGSQTDAFGMRARAIENYRSFLENHPKSSHRKDVLRRLADLEVKQASSILALSYDAEAMTTNPQAESRRLFDAAVVDYEMLIREYPEEQQNPEVTYQLAQAQEGSGRLDQSTATLTRISDVEVHGNSELQSDAQFRQAEALFSRGDYDAAESLYRAIVLEGPRSQIYMPALYKLSWTLYKQGRFQEGLTSIDALLDHVLPAGSDLEQQMASLSQPDREQLNDALRVMSLCFSNLGGSEIVGRHFDRTGQRHYETLAYEALADLYLAEERYHDAAQTLLAVAGRDTAAEASPDYHARAIAIYDKAEFRRQAVEVKEAYVLLYGPGSTFWEKRGPQPGESGRTMLASVEADIIEYYDEAARLSRGETEYREAKRWYETYLTTFDDAEDAPKMRFQFAELAFFTSDFLLAAQHYERSAYDYGLHPLAAEAAYGSVLAWQAILEGETNVRRESLVPRFVASAERFASQFPADPQAAEALVRAAQELLSLEEFERSASISGELARAQPPTQEAARRAAWIIYARSQTQLGDHAEAEMAYRAALALTNPGAVDHDALRASVAAAIYRQGEQSLAEERPGDAGAQFTRAAAAGSNTPVHAEATYQSAVSRLAAEDWGGAARTFEEFRRQYPQHTRYPDATRSLAIAYRKAGQAVLAAEAFVEVAQITASDQVRRGALIEASDLYRNADRFQDAVAVLEQYLDSYQEITGESIEVRWQLAELSEDLGDASGRRRWLEDVIKSAERATPPDRPRARFLAAEATLALADSETEAFRRVRLVEPVEVNLSKKSARMQIALDMYEEVASYGFDETTSAATFRTAELYREFGEELRSSQRPGELQGSELSEYEALLEQQAEPFTKRAMEIHEANFRQVRDGVYNTWIAASLEQLAHLQPARYERREMSEPFVQAVR